MGPTGEPRKDPAAMRLLRQLGLAHRQPQWRRLGTDIEGLQAWVDAHRNRHAPMATEAPRPWYERCDELLAKAQLAAQRGDIDSGYEYLGIAEREAVPGMSPQERELCARSLRAEAERKLGGTWRGAAILKLLGPEGAAVSPEALAQAVWHRATHERNSHRKMDSLRWQLVLLGLIVLALVLVAFVFAVLGLPDLKPETNLMPYGIYLGLLGGFFSSAISVTATDRGARVPEVEVAFQAAVARGLLGAAASIPVYMLAKTGLVAIGGATLSQTWGLLLLCFLSGFSERWFLGTLASVTRDGKAADKPDAAPK